MSRHRNRLGRNPLAAVIVALASVVACTPGPPTAEAVPGSSAPATSATVHEGAPDDATTVPVPTTWPPGTDPSPGCFAETRGHTDATPLVIDGVERTYRYRPAKDADPDAASPVILLLHGLGSDAATVLDYSVMASAADQLGAGLVLPDAVGDDRRWTAADVAFLGEVLDTVEADRCIDRSREWLAGLSMGGFMSARLACDLGGRFAAVGAVAGFGYDAATCPVAPPTPLVTFHGTADSVIPYAGRPPGFVDVIPSDGADADMADWAAHNGCAPTPTDEVLGSEVTVRRWNGCAADTVQYIIVGGGHSWPGAYPYPRQGYTTAQVSATAVIADFFATHRTTPAGN